MSRTELNPAFDAIIGDSPSFVAALLKAQQAADTPWPILITGETGTGKTAVAEAIHRASGRPGRFVALNCAALTPSLLESELFGHQRGSFTGANTDSPGLFRSADGGTLFLDEVGDMSLEAQAKLLRAVETGRVRAIGAETEVAVDVRLVAATHCPLQSRVEQGRFREDLLYRIGSFVVDLPPLRDRGADVALLADAFLQRESPGRRFSPAALAVLQRWQWPGNLRELQSVIRQSLLGMAGSTIDVGDLPPLETRRAQQSAAGATEPAPSPPAALAGPVPEVPTESQPDDAVTLMRRALASPRAESPGRWAAFLLRFAHERGVTTLQRADMMECLRSVRGPSRTDNALRLEWNREIRPWLTEAGLLSEKNRRQLQIEFDRCKQLVASLDAVAAAALQQAAGATASVASAVPSPVPAPATSAGPPATVDPVTSAGASAWQPDALRTNLPARADQLIGRDSVLDELERRVLDDESPIVTLTGAGGVGKTALAIAAGRRLLPQFAGGCWLVDLSGAHTAEDIVHTTASALGLIAAGGQPIGERIEQALAMGGQRLLIFDNFEQVIDHAAATVGHWIEKAPQIRTLVTSRALLRVRDEVRLPLEPLSPPAMALGVVTAASLSGSEAVELFVMRATQATAGFELTDETAPHVAQVCSLVGGLPLAIEMAAARLKVLPVRELARRLGESFDLLRTSRRDVPDHRRALRDTLSWSLDLLAPEEREAFELLCIFRGGFTVQGAEIVLGELHAGLLVIDAIESLLDKSLLRRREVEFGVRYDFYPVIREHGLEQLAARLDADTRLALDVKHGEWVAGRFEELLDELEDNHRPTRIQARLDAIAESDNLTAAIELARGRGDRVLHARLAVAAGEVAMLRGEISTREREWLQQAVDDPPPDLDEPQGLWLHLLWAVTILFERPAEPTARQVLNDRLQELMVLPADRLSRYNRRLANTLMASARLWTHALDYERAMRDVEAAEAFARRTGDELLLAEAVASRAVIDRATSPQTAHDELLKAEEVARRTGRKRLLHRMLQMLGLSAGHADLPEEALRHIEEAGTCIDARYDPSAFAMWSTHYGEILARLGEDDRAVEVLMQGEYVATQVGVPLTRLRANLWLARVALWQGRLADTHRLLDAAEQIRSDPHMARAGGVVRMLRGYVYLAEHRPVEALAAFEDAATRAPSAMFMFAMQVGLAVAQHANGQDPGKAFEAASRVARERKVGVSHWAQDVRYVARWFEKLKADLGRG